MFLYHNKNYWGLFQVAWWMSAVDPPLLDPVEQKSNHSTWTHHCSQSQDIFQEMSSITKNLRKNRTKEKETWQKNIYLSFVNTIWDFTSVIRHVLRHLLVIIYDINIHVPQKDSYWANLYESCTNNQVIMLSEQWKVHFNSMRSCNKFMSSLGKILHQEQKISLYYRDNIWIFITFFVNHFFVK